MMSFTGAQHDSFSNVRHIGFSSRGLLRGWRTNGYQRYYRHRECPCDDFDACPRDDACRPSWLCSRGSGRSTWPTQTAYASCPNTEKR
ncbi:hypothetical protein PG994_008567 [Apiospora phragmitis]|uniref:Uncharacterized protein n=1 Tax=Apiospora phragmitis TaxID=2905665 RepID=A0ABR1UGU4_9PEZI